MEVDATSDDSDATVAGEEDFPNAPEAPRFPPLGVGSSSQAVAAASQLTQSSRASDGEDTGPVSPSLLHGYARHLETQQKQRYKSI